MFTIINHTYLGQNSLSFRHIRVQRDGFKAVFCKDLYFKVKIVLREMSKAIRMFEGIPDQVLSKKLSSDCEEEYFLG